jgi:alpha-1,3-rhamnosyl/mannosyltransferase
MLRHPDRFRGWHLRSARHSLVRLTGVDRVICISHFTADEAMALLHLSASRLVVVHIGCDFKADTLPPETTPPGPPLPDEFFLFVGSLEPGKNLVLLRTAYQQAREQGHHLPDLVVAGARFAGLASEGEAPRNWHYLGRIPDSALVHLYRRALALVFPSKYEGFGLPVAEAMTLGCPVICSRVASLPEVAGDAALYADATPEAYLTAMRRLLKDGPLRASLQALGRRQASRFSWQRCARETLEVYQA